MEKNSNGVNITIKSEVPKPFGSLQVGTMFVHGGILYQKISCSEELQNFIQHNTISINQLDIVMENMPNAENVQTGLTLKFKPSTEVMKANVNVIVEPFRNL